MTKRVVQSAHYVRTQRSGGNGARRWCGPFLFALFTLIGLAGSDACAEAVDGVDGLAMAGAFAAQVDKRLDVPEREQAAYAARLDAALSAAGRADPAAQYVVLVDRSPAIQALFIYWRSPDRRWHFIGASPVSTGLPGTYDHFITPLGVFAHTTANMDFRAEGTRNELGVRGYGLQGMRIYDFGWVTADRGWGAGGRSEMRLQMHATDPDLLEPRLGQRHSKGCIRIPASLDRFIDQHGLLDADYELAAAHGQRAWVLSPDRAVTAYPGSYLVVVDSMAAARPSWANWRAARAKVPRAAAGERASNAAC